VTFAHIHQINAARSKPGARPVNLALNPRCAYEPAQAGSQMHTMLAIIRPERVPAWSSRTPSWLNGDRPLMTYTSDVSRLPWKSSCDDSGQRSGGSGRGDLAHKGTIARPTEPPGSVIRLPPAAAPGDARVEHGADHPGLRCGMPAHRAPRRPCEGERLVRDSRAVSASPTLTRTVRGQSSAPPA
jgi:hypothetical protein